MRLYARHHVDIGWADLAFAIRALAAAPRRDPQAAFDAYWPGDRTAVPCLSVRTAFDALLIALGLPEGSEIIMSAVTISGMRDIALHHGLVVRAVDVDPSTLAVSPEAVAAAMSKRTRLILLAHLFGSRIDLAPFAHFRSDKVLLVEDCAQSWSPDFRGSESADVSLFSFGPIKTLTALGGGMAVFRDEALARRFAAGIAAYPMLGRGWYFRRIAKYAAMKLASGPLAYGLICRAVAALGRDVDAAIAGLTRGFGQTPDIGRFRCRPPAAMLALMARRIASPEGVGARGAAARQILAGLPPDRAVGGAAPGCSYWVTPILVDDPEAVRKLLMAEGFDATRGTTSMRVVGGDADATAQAAIMMRRILYLPSPQHLPEERREALKRLLAASPERG